MSTAAVPTGTAVNPLLARYLLQLTTHPLRTKAVTTGILSFLQEVLGSNIAGVPAKRLPKDASFLAQVLARLHIDVRALKMAIYGFLVSAPLGHVLVGALQKAFAGKTSPAAKIGQILASNLLVAPIQTCAFLSSMAIINGAKTKDEVLKTVKGGFFSVIRITWVMSPLSLTIAQNFLPPELWVPFFNAVQFVLGTYFNTKVKQARLAALKKEKERDGQGSSTEKTA
jgi:peroxisomal membrane protein 2